MSSKRRRTRRQKHISSIFHFFDLPVEIQLEILHHIEPPFRVGLTTVSKVMLSRMLGFVVPVYYEPEVKAAFMRGDKLSYMRIQNVKKLITSSEHSLGWLSLGDVLYWLARGGYLDQILSLPGYVFESRFPIECSHDPFDCREPYGIATIAQGALIGGHVSILRYVMARSKKFSDSWRDLKILLQNHWYHAARTGNIEL